MALPAPKPNKFEAQYFPTSGIHEVPNPDGASSDYIASFPTWSELEEGLKNNLPSSGRIITPEFAGAPDDLWDLRRGDSKELTEELRDRLRIIKELSRATEAEIQYGTPYRARVSEPGKAPREVWHNSVLTLKGGNLVGITHKDADALLPMEHQLGIQPSPSRMRTIRNGAAVLICAELFSYNPPEGSPMREESVTDVLASTMWATPSGDRLAPSASTVERAGGAYEYYKGALDKAVNKRMGYRLPNVNRVVVADRGVAAKRGQEAIPPLNAVYTIKKNSDERAA